MNELFRALPALMKEFDDNEAVREAVVLAAWKRVAGESLGNHAVAEKLTKKRLTVAVKGETWKNHLEQLSGQMIFKLNSFLGNAAVTFIEFRVDEELVEARNGKLVDEISEADREQLALDQISPRMRAAAAAIKDDNLRYRFLLAAGSCLIRKKNMAEGSS